MASPFVPKGREELLLRTPLTFGFTGPSNMYQPSNSQNYQEAVRSDFSAGGSREQQRARIKRMSRNTPHTSRVRPLRGLTDGAICSVEDNTSRPRPMSALTNRDLGSGYKPPGSSRYSANTNKHLFAVGVVPVTYAWRDELLRKAQKAISKALGQDLSASLCSSRPVSRQSSRDQLRQFDHLEDRALLDMMCKILHTDSVPRCQDWMNNATEDEKDVVLDMIRLAALGGEGETALPTRPPSRYVWQPPSRQSRRHSEPLLGESLDLLSLNTHPRFLFQSGNLGGGGGEGERGGGGEGRGGRRAGEKGILPKISHPQHKDTQVESTSGQGRQDGRKKQSSKLCDAATQLDDPETEKSRSKARKKKTEEKEKKRQVKEKRDIALLPPLHQSQQQPVMQGQYYSHCKGVSGRNESAELCVTGRMKGGSHI